MNRLRNTAPNDESHDAQVVRQNPVLSVKTLGPRRISVGKESSYELILRNAGQAAADEVVVTVDLPEWADVVGSEVSTGQTDNTASAQSPRQLAWRIARLEAKGQEKMVLRLVPRQSRPIELGVTWDYTPVASQMVIEVQEPRLEMHLDGAREVIFGQRELYRLELANTGNGDAENVEISLLPVGTGDTAAATHKFGTLAAGDKKTIEVELTARQTGTLTIKVDARGDGNLATSLTETIQVRRAELQLTVEAPKMQFVGAQVTYRIRVVNPGNAAATNVQLLAQLPLGTKYLSSTAEGKLDAEQRELTWKLDSLAPAAEQTFDVVCSLERPGISRMEVTATADTELTASANAATQVEAIADLRLDVVDPAGAVQVGEDAVYQIEVRNRGSKSADDVDIVAYFSRGIEPYTVEGASHRIAPGQVVFDKIPTVGPGQTLTLKIRAKAEVAGSHVFRAEVYCKPLETRLVAEETTHFYGGSADSPEDATVQRHETVPSVPALGDRTADRRESLLEGSSTDPIPPSATTPRNDKLPTPAARSRLPFGSLK